MKKYTREMVLEQLKSGDKDFSNCDLSELDLSWTNLSDANLSGADLSGADLMWADLRGAKLSKTVLKFACVTNLLIDCDMKDKILIAQGIVIYD